MKIVEKNIEELQEYENNPRRNDGAVKAVAESLRRFRWKQPIVIDKNGVIVAGHTRYKAAQQLGMTTIPCVIADDLTDEEIKAYRLTDNRTAELAEWDFDALNAELSGIFDIDMTAFGFSFDKTFEGLSDDNGAKELDLSEYGDENFACQCPRCGFRFNA